MSTSVSRPPPLRSAMELEYNVSISGKKIISETNLRDETFWKLVADFYGSQAGLELGLNTEPCRNKLLIQVGLMREDNHLTWAVVVEWLQKILPDHQFAFFQGLIETGIATTLSLGADARRTFLESEVNFNFVGPMCDMIGVGRMALLERRDFSEQAKSIEVTNGLILELSDFVTREELDPMVIVTWLRNFHPLFCKDGDIKKAYTGLKPRIKQLTRSYHNYKTRSYRRNTAMETLLQSPFELVRETRKSNKKRSKKERSLVAEKTHTEKRRRNEEISPVLREDNISFFDLDSNEGNIRVKVEVIPTANGSTRAVNKSSPLRKTTIAESTDGEKRLLTLLDIAMINIQKLACTHKGRETDYEKISWDLFTNEYGLLCKEHPGIKEFENKISLLAEDVPLATPFEFLHHNANFFVSVHDAIERELMRVEGEITTSQGEKLGRDKNPKFERFVDFSESATSRYIHMACDVLCPDHSDYDNHRKHWVEFCEEKGNPSKLNANLSNEQLDIRGYFEATAGLVHHHEEIPLFFSDLLLMDEDDCPNVFLESINGDATDEVIQSLVCVLAVIYCKILGPYHQLLLSASEYRFYCRYILCLYQKLLEWSKNPSTLLEPEEEVNVFLQEPLQERMFDRVFQYCGKWHTNRDLIRSCLKSMLKVIVAVVDEHLMDFLPGGKYSQSPHEDDDTKIAGCTFSALMREYPFNNPFPKLKTTRRKRCTSESSSGDDDSTDSSDSSDSPASPLAKKALVLNTANSEEKVGGGEGGDDDEEEDEVTRQDSGDDADQRESLNMDRKYVIATVSRNGGPCKTQQDVDKLLMRFESKSAAEKVEALRCEILYQKMVLDNNDPNLEVAFGRGHVYATHISSKLKLSLPRVKPGYCFVLSNK